MRTLFSLFIILSLFSTGLQAQSNPEYFFKKTAIFMKKYVFDGLVNYDAIKQNRGDLNTLMEQMAGMTQLETLEPNTKKAFLINAYNLVVIANIIEQSPARSPMDVPGFFERLKHNIGGHYWSADQIENKKLRPEYKDARLHFVLVCGAKGCPPLVNFAYMPSKLEQQLEEQTKKALNDANFIRVDDANQKVGLSEIFKWYESDFKMTAASNLAYINTYRNTAIPAGYKPYFYAYDWTLNRLPVKGGSTTAGSDPMIDPIDNDFNLQTYNAGSLLQLGQIDVTLFNSMYTQTETNWQGTTSSGFRETLGGSLLQFSMGVSKNARINLGFDINLKYTARSGDSTFASFTDAFAFTNTDTSRVGISSVGPRIKISPFKGANNFSIQSTFLLPVAANPEGLYGQTDPSDNRYWLDWDRLTWWNQFFYTRDIADGKMQLFFEGDVKFLFRKRRTQVHQVQLPVSAFVSYFPTQKVTLYAMSQHTPTFVMNPALPHINDWPVGASNTAAGVGFKYQPTSNLNIELLYTHFFQAINGGFGRTFNIGIKYIR